MLCVAVQGASDVVWHVLACYRVPCCRVLSDSKQGCDCGTGEWALALEQLAKSNHANLYYQHAPTLMQHAPVSTHVGT